MNTRKGFTLVELLVVIAILAILATVSVVGYTSFIDRANMSNAQTEADQIKSVISNGTMIDDYVIIVADDATTADKNEGIYYVKATGKFTSTKPTTGVAFNGTSEVAELVAKGAKVELDETNNKLFYTNFGYKVDVMARTATKDSK